MWHAERGKWNFNVYFFLIVAHRHISKFDFFIGNIWEFQSSLIVDLYLPTSGTAWYIPSSYDITKNLFMIPALPQWQPMGCSAHICKLVFVGELADTNRANRSQFRNSIHQIFRSRDRRASCCCCVCVFSPPHRLIIWINPINLCCWGVLKLWCVK